MTIQELEIILKESGRICKLTWFTDRGRWGAFLSKANEPDCYATAKQLDRAIEEALYQLDRWRHYGEIP